MQGTSFNVIISAQAVVASPNFAAFPLMGLAGWGATLRLNSASTGSLAGAFKVQITDFGSAEPLWPAPASGDWVDYPGSSQTWAAATLAWTFTAVPGNKLARIVFTNAGSAGAPTVDLAITGQAWVA